MPTKEQVRQWMQKRQVAHQPPPTPEQIKRELGWDLIPKPNNTQR
jgi:hypothetical protein